MERGRLTEILEMDAPAKRDTLCGVGWATHVEKEIFAQPQDTRGPCNQTGDGPLGTMIEKCGDKVHSASHVRVRSQFRLKRRPGGRSEG